MTWTSSCQNPRENGAGAPKLLYLEFLQGTPTVSQLGSTPSSPVQKERPGVLEFCFHREAHGAFCPVQPAHRDLPKQGLDQGSGLTNTHAFSSIIKHRSSPSITSLLEQFSLCFHNLLCTPRYHKPGWRRQTQLLLQIPPASGKDRAIEPQEQGSKVSAFGLGHCHLWSFPRVTSSLLTKSQATHTKMTLRHREGTETRRGLGSSEPEGRTYSTC